jgi:hypothetical protein
VQTQTVAVVAAALIAIAVWVDLRWARHLRAGGTPA